MRTVIFALLCSSCVVLAAMEWKPSENPSPRQILKEARADARDGRYEDALAKHLWFHQNAMKYDSGLYGVRLSFALSDWKRISKKYPPALSAMKRVRYEAKQDVLNGQDARHSFIDYMSLVEVLGDEEDGIVQLFLKLRKTQRNVADDVFYLARSHLVEASRFTICAEHIDEIAEFDSFVEKYKSVLQSDSSGIGSRTRAENELEYQSAFLIALLARAGLTKDCNRLLAKAKQVMNYDSSCSIFDAAAAGRFPKKPQHMVPGL